jgi:hypothetical protein
MTAELTEFTPVQHDVCCPVLAHSVTTQSAAPAGAVHNPAAESLGNRDADQQIHHMPTHSEILCYTMWLLLT